MNSVPEKSRGNLAESLNLGPVSSKWLAAVGIHTVSDLRKVGSVDAWWRVSEAGFNPTLNLLYALEGALQQCHWAELSPKTKQRLQRAIRPSAQ